jgi:hypothetical protein
MNVEYAGVTLTCSGNASDLRVANDLRITTSISGADSNTYQDAANQIWFQNCIPFDVLSCSNYVKFNNGPWVPPLINTPVSGSSLSAYTVATCYQKATSNQFDYKLRFEGQYLLPGSGSLQNTGVGITPAESSPCGTDNPTVGTYGTPVI